MAPSTNKTYRICSHYGSGKYLNVYGNDQVSANRNVCLWSLEPVHTNIASISIEK